MTQIQTQKLKYKNFIEDYNKNTSNWVLDININKKDKMYSGRELITQPVWGHKYLPEFIWDHYDHVIFMSGTILNRDMFSYINGLDTKITTYHEMWSPFHTARRPIFYIQASKMTFNEKKENFEEQKNGLER